MKPQEIIKALENGFCDDPFCCPFGMFGKNKNGNYGCFARWPNGNPDEPDQGCVAIQAAHLIETLIEKDHAEA